MMPRKPDETWSCEVPHNVEENCRQCMDDALRVMEQITKLSDVFVRYTYLDSHVPVQIRDPFYDKESWREFYRASLKTRTVLDLPPDREGEFPIPERELMQTVVDIGRRMKRLQACCGVDMKYQLESIGIMANAILNDEPLLFGYTAASLPDFFAAMMHPLKKVE